MGQGAQVAADSQAAGCDAEVAQAAQRGHPASHGRAQPLPESSYACMWGACDLAGTPCKGRAVASRRWAAQHAHCCQCWHRPHSRPPDADMQQGVDLQAEGAQSLQADEAGAERGDLQGWGSRPAALQHSGTEVLVPAASTGSSKRRRLANGARASQAGCLPGVLVQSDSSRWQVPLAALERARHALQASA